MGQRDEKTGQGYRPCEANSELITIRCRGHRDAPIQAESPNRNYAWRGHRRAFVFDDFGTWETWSGVFEEAFAHVISRMDRCG